MLATENTPWIFARSATKPFQVIPLLGYLPHLPLDLLALCCASHSGTAEHQHRVKSLLGLAKTQVEALQCGCHLPVDSPTRLQLLKAGLDPSPLHHNCSGKHAGMLLCCHAAGWPQSHYLDPDHPLQQAIVDVMKTLTGEANLQTAVDGCGAPTFYMPLHALARLYYLLANQHPLCVRQGQAMAAFPQLMGGHGRIDTAIIQATQGQVLAKVGADGVMGLAHLPTQTGVALKVGSGNEDARNRFTLWWLAQQGWITENTPGLQLWQSNQRLNTVGTVVGHYVINPVDY